MARTSRFNLPHVSGGGLSPPMKMILDGPDPALLAHRIRFVEKFGGAKLFEFENPHFGMSPFQFERCVNNMFGPIPGTVHEASLNSNPLHASTLDIGYDKALMPSAPFVDSMVALYPNALVCTGVVEAEDIAQGYDIVQLDNHV